METQCVKVKSLRQKYGKDVTLKTWMEMDNSLYVGRGGRVFIKNVDGNEVFHYKSSKWHNPYKVGVGQGKYSLDESIVLYHNRILTSDLKDQLGELEGKTLGCFCDQSGKCHAKTLLELYIRRDNLPKLLKLPEKEEETLCI